MQNAIKSTLSKKRYAAGLQCLKRLWLQAHAPEKGQPPGSHAQFLMEQGLRVGHEARKLLPEGVLVSETSADLQAALSKTASLIQEKPTAIFEGAFTYDNVNIRVDILEKATADSWNLIEVKSSTKVKKEHIPDMAIQLWVLRNSGIKIDNCFLMHVNNKYEYGQPWSGFFSREDITAKVTSLLDTVSVDVPKLFAVLAWGDEPQQEMGPFCKPTPLCEFFDYCGTFRSNHHIMEIPRLGMKKYDDLIQSGINQIRDIPDHFQLSPTQARVRECVVQERDFIDSQLSSKLNDVNFPIYYLDFETINPAFPLFPGTRPYQIIPFQYSIHVLDNWDAEPTHAEYLHLENDNPMPTVAARLVKDMGESGTICMYTNYEERQINTLADNVSEYKEKLKDLLPRLWDVREIIKDDYYHPGFCGSFSIKDVLPALVSGMSYKGMEVSGGGEATVEYLKLIDPDRSQEEKTRIAQGLLDYCCQDTLAMLRVHRALLKKSEA